MSGASARRIRATRERRFTGGVSANSRVADAAKQLLKFLTGPTVFPVIRAQGMEPAL
jgi:hypothetical protein